MKKIFIILLLFSCISCVKYKATSLDNYKGTVLINKKLTFSGEYYNVVFKDGLKLKEVTIHYFELHNYKLGDTIK